MKKIDKLITVVLLVFSLPACVNSTTSVDPQTTVSKTEYDSTLLSFDMPESDSKPIIPSYGCSWTLPNGADDENTVIFDGEPIKLTCSYENAGTGDFEIGIRIFIAGVLQRYSVEEMPNEDYKLFSFSLPEGMQKEFHILLTPNVGNVGDELEMQLVDVTYPNYVVHTNDPAEGYNSVFSGFSTMNVRVLYNTGAPKTEDISTGFSGGKVSDVDPLIRMFIDQMSGSERTGTENIDESLYSFLYNLSVSEVLDANEIGVTHSDFLLEADKNQQFTINLCGKPGKYRIAFFVNHHTMPVFDGCSYADVEVFDNQQTELIIRLDTTELNDFNHCYYTIYRIDNSFDIENEVMKLPTQKLNIKK